MKVRLLFAMLFAQSCINVNAQTSDCDNTAAGQLTVGTSCAPVTFNSTNNTDYWNAAVAEGFCGETDQDDAWMWFDATSTSTTVTYTPSSGNPILTIFQGACSSTMNTNIDCSNNPGLSAETVTFPTIPGMRYRVRIQNNLSDASMNGTVCAFSPVSGPTTASDCPNAVNICTNLSFSIDPNGFGMSDEIPAPGNLGNPMINPFSANAGCLLIGESNSTWMIVNIATSGNLEFVFGGLGAQSGFYDWIMYPYTGPATCTAISNNTLAPIRCNWNGVDYGGTGLSDVVPAGGDVTNFEPPLPVLAGQRYIICFSNYSSVSTTVPLQFLTDPGDATVSCIPLGIHLGSISIECKNGYREIHWTTDLTSETSSFTIESSRDLVDWSVEDELIQGTQTGNSIHYSHKDLSYTDQLLYYRINEHLQDGETIHSEAMAIDCFGSQEFQIYPNPTNAFINFNYRSAEEGMLQLYDMQGKIVYEQLLESSLLGKTKEMDVSYLDGGFYHFRVTLSEGTFTGRLIVKK